LFHRPNPTAGCSANGRKKKKRKKINVWNMYLVKLIFEDSSLAECYAALSCK
jgi:hypothetical protein